MGGSSKRQVVAYKYYEDQHIVLALSNFDFISRIWFADKLAWVGEARGLSDGYSQISINKPNLFGGEKREGGVAGTIDVGMGWPDQPKNSYLVSRLGSALMPAYRGVVSLIFKNFYFGNNPYLKAMKIRAQAIHKLSDGSQQWYDTTAEIYTGSGNDELAFFQERFDYSLFSEYSPDSTAEPYADSNCSVSGGSLSISAPYPSTGYIYRPIGSEITVTRVTGKFTLDNATSGDDIAFFSLRDSSNTRVFSIFPRRGEEIDNLRRCHINSQVGQPGTVLSSSELSDGVRYRFDAQFDNQNFRVDVQLYNDETGVLVGSVSDVPYLTTRKADKLSFNMEGTDSVANYGGAILWRDIDVYGGLPTGDINPVHFIRECHTDKIWGGRYPESKMGSSYATAADTIYAEGLGVSFLFTDEVPWKEIIEEVARHIDAIPYQDPDTGLMEIKLIRDDYDIETIPVLGPDNSDLERIQEPNDWEIFNQVIIKFWNRATGKNDSVSLSDPAAIDMVGGPKPKTFEYSGICTKKVATMVGERDLARVSKPFHQGRIKTNRSVANLKPGDVFLLNSPEDDIESMVCRVTSRKENGLLNGEITLEFGEDVFGKVFTTFSQPSDSVWVDPVGDPQAFKYETVFEVPYYLIVQDIGEDGAADLSTDACFYGFAGVAPDSGAHIDYDLYIYPDGTTQEPDIEFALTAAFTPHAVISADVPDPNTLVLPVEPLSGMDSVRVGQIAFLGNGDDSEREAVAVDAEVAEGDTTITVRRGVIDTTPKPITSGTVLYFVETFYGGSETEYMPSEVVEGYGVPTNGLGAYSGPYTYHDLTMAGRFYKPYPPGDLRLDNLPLPVDYRPPDNTVEITWNYRDRVVQSDQVIDFFDTNDYGPEANTTFRVDAEPLDSNGDVITPGWFSLNVGLVKTYTFDLGANSPPAGTVVVNIKVWTVRDGEVSLQAAEAQFNVLAPPSGLSAVYKPLEAPGSLAATEV